MDSREITPQEARAELARRELARRESMRADTDKQMQIDQFRNITGIDRSALDTVRDVAGGAISGLGKGGQLIASALTGGKAPTVDMDELESKISSPNRSIGGELAKGIGSYLPYGAAGGSSVLGQVGAGLAHGAATTEPDESNLFGILPQGKVGGALKEAIFNTLTAGGAKTLEALRPSKMFRGTLSPEELKKNAEIAGDTNTGLGDVIASPYLKRQYENVLPYVPFSGANEAMMGTANQVKKKGSDILEKIGMGNQESNQGLALQTALKDAAKEARIEKENNYKTLNDMAEKSNLTIGRSNMAEKARDTINEINSSEELKREFPAGLLSDLEHYASNEKGNNLKLSNIFKGKLGDKANELYSEGRMHEYGIVKGLQDSLQKDIDSAIEGSGNKSLKDQYTKSQTEYREKFAPFEDPDIVKFTRQGGDPDLILSHFLRTGANDRSNLIAKVVDKLPQSSSLLPLKMYLSKSVENGEVDPLKLRTLYNKLGENQKNVLIKDKSLRNQLDSYADLVGKNTEPLSVMANPKTGQRNIDALSTGILALLGHGIAGNYGALAGGILPVVGGRMATKALTSPEFRNKLVQSIIEDKLKFSSPNKVRSVQGLEQALAAQLSQGNQNGT